MNKLFLIFIFIISTCAVAKNQLVYFEPRSVELTGIVKKLAFPGPPNYTSLRDGDINESGRYLILQGPIDVDLAPGEEQMGNDEFTQNVNILQLVVHKDSDWEKLKNNSYVRIRGTLFKAMFGHHHSRVLLEVEEIYGMPDKKNTPDDIVLPEDDYRFMTMSDGIDQDFIFIQKIKLKSKQNHGFPFIHSTLGIKSRSFRKLQDAYSLSRYFVLISETEHPFIFGWPI